MKGQATSRPVSSLRHILQHPGVRSLRRRMLDARSLPLSQYAEFLYNSLLFALLRKSGAWRCVREPQEDTDDLASHHAPDADGSRFACYGRLPHRRCARRGGAGRPLGDGAVTAGSRRKACLPSRLRADRRAACALCQRHDRRHRPGLGARLPRRPLEAGRHLREQDDRGRRDGACAGAPLTIERQPAGGPGCQRLQGLGQKE